MRVAALSICAMHDVHEAMDEIAATHLLSMLDHGTRVETPDHLHPRHHLHMHFSDTDDRNDPNAPTINDIRRIHSWADDVPEDGRIVIHCYMGISRSTSVALGLMARHMRPTDAAEKLLKIRPQAAPNRLIVSHWDEILELDGALNEAAELLPLPFWASEDWT
ncbi:MAG: phosphatase [Alphaproteobacteria bacterium]